MSVVESKRKPSGFEVFDQLNRIRVEITNLIFRDFGFKFENVERHAGRLFGHYRMEELRTLNPEKREAMIMQITAEISNYIKDAALTVKDLLRLATAEVHIANDIIPTRWAEYDERRLRQDRAIGYLHTLTLELEAIIDDLPVNANVFFRIATLIDREIGLIKSWRQADNKFKPIVAKNELEDMRKGEKLRATSDSATNFANVNNNGNANYNNASNSNGVRPYFDSLQTSQLSTQKRRKEVLSDPL